MKEIIKIKLEKILKEHDADSLKDFFAEIGSRLNEIQKEVINNRRMLIIIGGVFIALVFKVLSVKKLALFLGFELTDEIIDTLGLENIDEVLICFLPLLFAVMYFFMISSLIYRSIMRYLHLKLYEKINPGLYRQHFHYFSMPPSPGHILKTLQRVIIPEKKKAQEAPGLVRFFRSLGIYFEISFHWVFMGFAFFQVFKMIYSKNPPLIWGIVILSTLVFLYGFFVATRYNNYLNIFDKEVAQIKKEIED